MNMIFNIRMNIYTNFAFNAFAHRNSDPDSVLGHSGTGHVKPSPVRINVFRQFGIYLQVTVCMDYEELTATIFHPTCGILLVLLLLAAAAVVVVVLFAACCCMLIIRNKTDYTIFSAKHMS